MRRSFCAGVVSATPSKRSKQNKFYRLPTGSAGTSASNTRARLANTGGIGRASLVISAACQADCVIQKSFLWRLYFSSRFFRFAHLKPASFKQITALRCRVSAHSCL